ncbi:TAF14B [Scenedesmus sp. PABB004]|nr:TAF14B [Scenedesmus sp. PABB004]
MMPGRLQNTELVVPVVVGTVAIHLGKKATEYASHRWTVYVRGLGNEDISHVVHRVTFNLHTSFQVPVRHVEAPPFEVTETGWGEFEIGVVLHFPPDSGEKDVELFHRLKLYGEDDPTGTKQKPVVHEQVEELVFVCPAQGFYQRVVSHVPRPRAPLSVEEYLAPPSEGEELATVQAARRKVAQLSAGLRLQLQAPAADSPSAAGAHMMMHHM